MSTLQISLFGGVQLSQDDWTTSVRMTRTIQVLLAYLLLHRQRPQPREIVAGYLWGEHSDEQARSCLSTALFRLRSILEPKGIPRGTYLLTPASGEIRFNSESDYWLDVQVLEDAAGAAISQDLARVENKLLQEMEQSLNVYKGELLEGFYDDWVTRERERIKNLHLEALIALMRFHGRQRAFEKALLYGRRILEQEPLREEIHREMMRFYWESGQRTQAVQQYQSCCRVLEAELNIRPMLETQLLLHEITQMADSANSPFSPAGNSLFLEQSLLELNMAKMAVDRVQHHLSHAINMAEQCLERQPR